MLAAWTSEILSLSLSHSHGSGGLVAKVIANSLQAAILALTDKWLAKVGRDPDEKILQLLICQKVKALQAIRVMCTMVILQPSHIVHGASQSVANFCMLNKLSLSYGVGLCRVNLGVIDHGSSSKSSQVGIVH